MTHPCPICSIQTSTCVCADCAQDLQYLGLSPDPDMKADDFVAWAKANKLTMFSCGKSATGEEPW